ncbi:MAG: Tn3 family transposase [Gammaproteobacteria bacterium]
MSTNKKDDQELAVVCLHLLQVCMVYINTLIIQEVLSDPKWMNKLPPEDKRALTPLLIIESIGQHGDVKQEWVTLKEAV